MGGWKLKRFDFACVHISSIGHHIDSIDTSLWLLKTISTVKKQRGSAKSFTNFDSENSRCTDRVTLKKNDFWEVHNILITVARSNPNFKLVRTAKNPPL